MLVVWDSLNGVDQDNAYRVTKPAVKFEKNVIRGVFMCINDNRLSVLIKLNTLHNPVIPCIMLIKQIGHPNLQLD
jgi:hypothetical protein